MAVLDIAGIKLELNYLYDDYFKTRISSYIASDNRNVKYVINCSVCDNITIPKGEIVDQFSNKMIIKTPSTKYILYFDSHKEITTKLSISSDYTKYDIIFCETLENISHHEYVLTGFIFQEISYLEGFISVHASAISLNNEAILFSGVSGVGKSTQSKLWLEFFDEAYIINDDKPLIKMIDEKFYVFGSPWSGKTGINQNTKVQLKALVFLGQGCDNQVRELSNEEKTFYLLNHLHRSFYDDDLTFLFNNIDHLIKKVLIYYYKCNISTEAVRVLRDKILGG